METFIRLTIEQENLTVINQNNYEEKLVAISFSSHPASTSVDTMAKGIKFSNEFLLHLFSKHRPFGPMLSISRFVRLSVCTFVRLFTFEVPFNGLFAPTSRSRMSNIFRDSESLRKSNGNKWSHI